MLVSDSATTARWIDHLLYTATAALVMVRPTMMVVVSVVGVVVSMPMIVLCGALIILNASYGPTDHDPILVMRLLRPILVSFFNDKLIY